MLRQARIDDATAIAGIYNHYVHNSIITFDEEPVEPAYFEQLIAAANDRHPWLVYAIDNEVVGYAYAGQWKSRCAYREAVESSIYLSHQHLNKGVGKALYKALLEKLATSGCYTVIGGIALPNDCSVALHEHFGFQKVAHFKAVGYKFNQRIDVAYWQLMLKT
jgi:phosphinothricin acetyltransferase